MIRRSLKCGEASPATLSACQEGPVSTMLQGTGGRGERRCHEGSLQMNPVAVMRKRSGRNWAYAVVARQQAGLLGDGLGNPEVLS